MTLWKMKKIVAITLLILNMTSCSTSQFNIVISSYSQVEQPYTDVGYSQSSWEIRPLITLDNGVSIKVHPLTWHSLTDNEEHCSKDYTEFTFMLWSQENLKLDFVNSYFISTKGEKVFIDTVKVAEKNTVLYRLNGINDEIIIDGSKFSSDELSSLWENNGYREMMKDETRKYLKITTSSFVGCPLNNYKLYISFKGINSDFSDGYWLYFYPVEYRALSR